MLDQSFNIYILLYVLLTLTKNAKLDQLIKEVRGGQYFSSMLGVIEIARDDGARGAWRRIEWRVFAGCCVAGSHRWL